ncbi:unnamed protein product [Merluccius merluccius]
MTPARARAVSNVAQRSEEEEEVEEEETIFASSVKVEPRCMFKQAEATELRTEAAAVTQRSGADAEIESILMETVCLG